MQIGILQPGHAPEVIRDATGDFDDMFMHLLAGQGFSFKSYDVEAGEIPSAPDEAEGWLITGSLHGAYEDHPWIAPLEAFIRATYEAAVPLVGICFGHQIIAQAFGGTVAKYDGGWAVGRQLYNWQGEQVALNAWHQDQVAEKPEGAEVVASNEFCTNAALVYGTRAFTVQPHPEFGANVVDGLIRYRAPGVVPEPLLDGARKELDAPTSSPLLADKIGAFFREARNG